MKSMKKLVKYLHPFVKNLYPAMGVSFGLQITAQIISLALVPLFYQKVIDSLDPKFIDNPDIYKYVFILIGMFTIVSISHRVSGYVSIWLQQKFMRILNKDVFDKFIKKDYHFYLDNFSGSLVAKFSKFTKGANKIYEMLNYNLLPPMVGLMAMLVVLSRKSWYLVVLFLGWTVLYIGIASIWAKIRGKTSLARTRAFSKLTGLVSDGLSNIHNVKAFGREEYEVNNFDEENDNWRRLLYKDWTTFVHGMTTTSVLNISFQGGSLLLGIYLWKEGVLTAGFVVLLMLYTRQLIIRIRHIGRDLPNLSSALSDTQEVIEIMEETIMISDNNFKGIVLGNHTISFKDISFTYPNGDHVFENFNLEIPEGQKIGVVGKSGSGKTTLVKLLLRFYDPSNGELSIGENIVKNLSQQEYRSNFISFIPQETTLFHRTLRENIMYGNQDAGKELFNEVVKSSYVEEFSSRLEEGYETKVGERGIRLSGGQRQRVGIARAMLKKDAPILIMDEATSALDSQSEQYIQNSFEKLSEGRTTIVIAHRLSTIQKMDRIIVMEHGVIVEDGSHDELIKKNGVYAGLWNSQIGGFITE